MMCLHEHCYLEKKCLFHCIFFPSIMREDDDTNDYFAYLNAFTFGGDWVVNRIVYTLVCDVALGYSGWALVIVATT